MSLQITHIISPNNVKYYDVDGNKTIQDIEQELSAKICDDSVSKSIVTSCTTTRLNKLWPLKFYNDTFFVQIQQPFRICIKELNKEFNVYLNPQNISGKTVGAALREVTRGTEQSWLWRKLDDSFTLDSQKENTLMYKISKGCAHYNIKITTEQDNELHITTKEVFLDKGYNTIEYLLQSIGISELPDQSNIESWIYKININGKRITDISASHPQTVNTMEIYPDRQKYSITYNGAEYTGNADDTLIICTDMDMLRRQDTKEKLTSLKFGDICGKDTNVGLEFYYDIKCGDYQIFVKTLTGKTLSINVHSNMSIGTLKQIINYKEGIPPSQQRLIFSMVQPGNHKKLGELGIKDLSYVHLVLRLRGGGGSCSFVNIRDGLTKKSFSEHGPSWYTCHNGLFLRGRCKNNKCDAYRCNVVINKEYEPFDLKYDKDNPKNVCPECGVYVKVDSFGFSNCKYKIEAEFTNGEKKTIIDSVRDSYVEPNVKSSSKTAEYTKFILRSEDFYADYNFTQKVTKVAMICDGNEKDINITEEITCPICYDVMSIHDKKKMCVTNCNHIYCKKCLPPWLSSSECNKCPMCRTNIDAIYAIKVN